MKELLEEKIRRKFWDLQNSQQQRLVEEEKDYDIKKRSAIYSGYQVFSVDHYCEEIRSEICSEWNKFCEEFVVEEIESLTLRIDAKDAKEERQKINCDRWVFPFKIEMSGVFDEVTFIGSVFKKELTTYGNFVAAAKFYNATFHGEAIFSGRLLESGFSSAKFFNNVIFRGVVFESLADFFLCRFENCAVIFEYSECAKRLCFEGNEIAGKVSFKFTNSRFFDRFDFYISADAKNNSEITKIDLRSSEFEKTTLFQQNLSSSGNCLRVGNLSLEETIFREPLFIKFQHLGNCPDFSKSYLLDIKKLSLNEKSWEKNDEINQQEVTKDNEAKFRFLKKYFADQGNHFKEQQYFSYEMMAREKKLRSEIFFRADFVKSFKNFSKNSCITWLKKFFELIPFFAYKWTSNFGMSWVRPLIWLIASAFVMSLYLKGEPKNYFHFFGEFFLFKDESLSFKEALLKTALPFSTALEHKKSLLVNFHCLINATLIFLFALALRNKFKTK